MKKRTEIQQDLKRGFGSAPTGIKIWGKWSLVGFMVYVAVRFVCAFVGGVVTGLGGVVTGLGGILPTLVVLTVVVFLIRSVWRILSAILFLSVLLLSIILFCVIF